MKRGILSIYILIAIHDALIIQNNFSNVPDTIELRVSQFDPLSVRVCIYQAT